MPDEQTIFLPNDRIAYTTGTDEKPILGTIRKLLKTGNFQIELDNGKFITAERLDLIHLKIKRI